MNRSLFLLAVLLLTQGCSEKKPVATSTPPSVGQDGWPTALYYARLQMPQAQMRRLATHGTAPGFNLVGQGVIRKHYDQIGPTAHGAVNGTDVYWLPEKNVFFLRSDCAGHHVDGYIGPFSGDPRALLEPESLRQARAK